MTTKEGTTNTSDTHYGQGKPAAPDTDQQSSSSHRPISTDENVCSWSRNVWEAAKRLEARQDTFYPHVTRQIVQILRRVAAQWDGDVNLRSFFDKRTLYRELEESIVAISFFMDWVKERSSHSVQTALSVIDVCAGKGLVSFFLSYLELPNDNGSITISQIVLLEKATNINWYHIDMANKDTTDQERPEIIIWSNTNLHDYDKNLNRLQSLKTPIAMIGIHLCKQLSPTFCGLVNGLDDMCVFSCLAPCCLPRIVTSQKHYQPNNDDNKKETATTKTKSFLLDVYTRESPSQRQMRQDYLERRERVRRKPTGGPCYLCHDKDHNLKDCPVLPTLPKDQRQEIASAYHKLVVPCWNCLEYGHYKSDCTATTSTAAAPTAPPSLSLDVSNVLASSNPFETYCELLSTSLQDKHTSVMQTPLVQDPSKHQAGNWNGQRKSIFLVSTSTT